MAQLLDALGDWRRLATHPAFWLAAAAVVLPISVPLLLVLAPLACLGSLVWLSLHSREAEQTVKVTLQKLVSSPPKEGAATVPPTAAPAAAANGKTAAPAPPAPKPAAPAPASAANIGTAVPAAGGAAILAKLRAQRASKSADAGAPKRNLVVLHASQLGTAREIAREIGAEAERRGLHSQVASMDEYGLDAVRPPAASLVVLVASSTGDGDPPDNAARFYGAVRRKAQPEGLLAGVQFTCLGLGDSNYTRFMHVPRVLRSRFAELGASPFYDFGEADEVEGLEDVVEMWKAGLWPALDKVLPPAGGGKAGAAESRAASAAGVLEGVPPPPACRVAVAWLTGAGAEAVRGQEAAGPSAVEPARHDPAGAYSAEEPFWAAISDARRLTSPLAGDREVLHLEFDLAGSGMAYAPGDSIGVLPRNDPGLVEPLARRLGLDPDAVFALEAVPGEEAAPAGRLLPHLRWPCTVRSALEGGCDLTTPPRKSLLRMLAEHCGDAADRARLLHLCSKAGRGDYAKDILEARPSLLDLLRRLPSCAPPLAPLLDALPPLPPRMYSAASAPAATPEKVSVAFSVVRYDTAFGPRPGVATAWLKRLAEPLLGGRGAPPPGGAARVPLFLRSGGDFRPPSSLEAPVVMVGPGTGVSPFRGFLQQRAAQIKSAAAGVTAGESWLFFGCRRADHDFLYEQDLKAFEAEGVLSHLCVAFSRAQAHKVYVQHLMQGRGAELCDAILSRGAYVFVCGDGASMAKDVQACLLGLLQQHGGLSEAEAAARLAQLTEERRYVRDIWS